MKTTHTTITSTVNSSYAVNIAQQFHTVLYNCRIRYFECRKTGIFHQGSLFTEQSFNMKLLHLTSTIIVDTTSFFYTDYCPVLNDSPIWAGILLIFYCKMNLKRQLQHKTLHVTRLLHTHNGSPSVRFKTMALISHRFSSLSSVKSTNFRNMECFLDYNSKKYGLKFGIWNAKERRVD